MLAISETTAAQIAWAVVEDSERGAACKQDTHAILKLVVTRFQRYVCTVSSKPTRARTALVLQPILMMGVSDARATWCKPSLASKDDGVDESAAP